MAPAPPPRGRGRAGPGSGAGGGSCAGPSAPSWGASPAGWRPPRLPPAEAAVFAPSDLSPRVKNLVASAVYKARQWVSDVSDIRAGDARAKQFKAFGASSRIAFPPGDVYGEPWISIGDRTLIGTHVTLAVGMPGEEFASSDAIIDIGARCSLGRGTAIVARQQVVIEDDVMIAPHVYITDHSHSYADVRFPI